MRFLLSNISIKCSIGPWKQPRWDDFQWPTRQGLLWHAFVRGRQGGSCHRCELPGRPIAKDLGDGYGEANARFRTPLFPIYRTRPHLHALHCHRIIYRYPLSCVRSTVIYEYTRPQKSTSGCWTGSAHHLKRSVINKGPEVQTHWLSDISTFWYSLKSQELTHYLLKTVYRPIKDQQLPALYLWTGWFRSLWDLHSLQLHSLGCPRLEGFFLSWQPIHALIGHRPF